MAQLQGWGNSQSVLVPLIPHETLRTKLLIFLRLTGAHLVELEGP